METGDESTVIGGEPSAAVVDAGRYQLLDSIGRGGMGEVLEARDSKLGRTVALKRLALETKAEHQARFESEALITARLEHTGVPPVYDRGQLPDGAPFYTMRRIHGRTLAEAIERCRDLDERLRLVPAVIQVARTVAFAHAQGVIHRDIKPSNVIVSEHGEVVLLDWGLAKFRELGSSDDPASATQAGEVLGTPAYMAPEQAEGEVERIDTRTDVFAIGALLYHVLSGRAPYAGDSHIAVVMSAAGGRPEPLHRVTRDVPAALREICERAMAIERSDRYPGAAEVAAALEACTATALRVAPRVGEWAAVGATVFMTLGVIAATTAMLRESPSFAEQGPGAWGSVSFTIVALSLAAIEVTTRGRHRLAPLVLGLALATAFLALATLGGGGALVLGNLAGAPPEHHAEMLRTGMAAALGTLATGASLASVQIVAWVGVLRWGRT